MSEFISAIKRQGLARTNRFKVELPLPGIVQSKFQDADKEDPNNVFAKAVKIAKNILGRGGEYHRGLEIMCESAAMPGMNMLTTDRRTNTTNVKFPYDVDYGDLPFTFYVSSDMLEKKIIDEWMGIIYDRNTHTFEYLENYSQDIFIHQLNERGEIVYSVTLFEAWPVTINSMDLTAGNNDLHKVVATFTYNHWRVGTVHDQEDSLLSKVKNPSDLLEIATNPKFLNKVYDFAVGNNPGFAGEALWVFDKMSDLVNKYANVSVTELAVMIATIKSDLNSNNNIAGADKTTLSNIADQILDRIKR